MNALAKVAKVERGPLEKKLAAMSEGNLLTFMEKIRGDAGLMAQLAPFLERGRTIVGVSEHRDGGYTLQIRVPFGIEEVGVRFIGSQARVYTRDPRAGGNDIGITYDETSTTRAFAAAVEGRVEAFWPKLSQDPAFMAKALVHLPESSAPHSLERVSKNTDGSYTMTFNTPRGAYMAELTKLNVRFVGTNVEITQPPRPPRQSFNE